MKLDSVFYVGVVFLMIEELSYAAKQFDQSKVS